MRIPHHLHAVTLVLASVVTMSACNNDDDDDDDAADDAADDESGGDDTDPSAGDDTDPSAGEDTDPSGGEDTDPSGGEDTDPSAGDGAEESSGDEASDESSSGAADEGPGGEFSISGTVARSEAAPPFGDNDAIGDVYVVVFDDACGGNAIGDGMSAAADLSDPANSVPFTVEGIGPGMYFVTGFLDDNGDYDPEAPGPNMGDIVMTEGAMAGCVEVEIVDANAEGVALLLNLALPFDPP